VGERHGDIANGKLQSAWEKITRTPFSAPYAGMYKHLIKLPGDIGLPEPNTTTGKLEPLALWGFDERGSYNAVCGWLQQLGVRWYLPGELGEVLPALKTIPLPKVDKIERPDFAMRRINFRFGTVGKDTSLWAMRLGLRDPFGIQIAHGMASMTGRDEVFAAPP